MRSGCINYLLTTGTAVAGTLLILGGFLMLAYGAFSTGSAGAIRMILTVIFEVTAIYVFLRVGKDILRDLRSASGNDETNQRSDDSDGI